MTDDPPTAFYVWRVWYTGSDGGHQIGPLFTRRRDATARADAEWVAWGDFKRTGRGQIFGQLKVERLPVAGSPPML